MDWAGFLGCFGLQPKGFIWTATAVLSQETVRFFFGMKPVSEGKQDGDQIKNVLEVILISIRKRCFIENRFHQLAVIPEFLLWFLSILPLGRRENGHIASRGRPKTGS